MFLVRTHYCSKEFVIPSKYKNKLKDTVFFHIEELNIYKKQEIFDLYKEILIHNFKTIKELKKIDYMKLIELKNNEIYKNENHKEKKYKYDKHTWHQVLKL